MPLVSSYKIFKDKNLITEFFSGNLSVDSYIDFKQKLIKDPDFSVNFNYFIYFKSVNFNVSEKEITKYIHFSNKHLSFNENRNVAIITETPNQVVPCMLFKIDSPHKNQKVEIFSTCETAFNWLGIKPLFIDELSFIKELQLN